MRIIAGKYKSRKLIDFEHTETRPTSDKARGGIFNTLVNDIDNAVFLDLFAGTGAMSFEALSRGAKKCYMVDSSINSVKNIKQNLQKLQCTNYELLNCDYLQALKKFQKDNLIFDIVFIDPPYKSNFGLIAIKMLYEYNLIDEDSVVVFEHENFIDEDNYFPLELIKQRKYGIAIVDYLSKSALNEEINKNE